MTRISTFDFDGTYLSWTTNGYAGHVQVLQGKFSINSDRGILIPKDDNLDLEYAALVLEPVLRSFAIGRVVDGKRNEYTKVRWEAFREGLIPVPVTANGELDAPAQRQVAERAKWLKALQFRSANHADTLESLTIDTGDIGSADREWMTINLGAPALFRLAIGKRVLRKNLRHDGIPCYSSNVLQPFGMVEQSLGRSYDSDVLIWGIDGDFNLNFVPAGMTFCATDHCGIIEVLEPSISAEYLNYALSLSKGGWGFDRTFRASLGRVARIAVSMPLDDHGGFDLAAQEKIVQAYTIVERYRIDVARRLRGVATAKIDLDPVQLLELR